MKLHRKDQQGGSVLLEGLIAICIFSFGMLGLVAYQSNMVAQSTQTSYRLNASMLVNSLLGAADADAANYSCYTYPSQAVAGANCTVGTAYVNNWVTTVKKMPGAATTTPTAALDASGNLTVTVSWKLPSEKASALPHQLVSIARPAGT
ncbi:hypothetical protein H8K32_15570 [Undibacterium jejuense]|uniref:Type IV pilus modification protein PilV n=2 Tax=Undibacterium jejuense TaxID=1344949 RepID=A0A923HMA5_9BURK|nr:hypothetical protein [Undibacterium jejuense]